jgi:hypothetical protein
MYVLTCVVELNAHTKNVQRDEAHTTVYYRRYRFHMKDYSYWLVAKYNICHTYALTIFIELIH